MAILKTERVFVTNAGVTNRPENGASGFTFDFVNCEGLADFCATKEDNPVKEFLKSSYRNLLTISYELVFAYLRPSGQELKLTGQPWYQFYRIIRNSLSHDFTFNVPKDRNTGAFITGAWRGRTISGSDHGKLISLSFIGWDGMWELYIDLRDFVKNDVD